jgi:hypothetical protein
MSITKWASPIESMYLLSVIGAEVLTTLTVGHSLRAVA